MFCFFIERRGGWISHGDRFLIIKENDYFVHLSNKSHSCVKVHSLPLVHFSHSCALLLKCTHLKIIFFDIISNEFFQFSLGFAYKNPHLAQNIAQVLLIYDDFDDISQFQ